MATTKFNTNFFSIVMPLDESTPRTIQFYINEEFTRRGVSEPIGMATLDIKKIELYPNPNAKILLSTKGESSGCIANGDTITISTINRETPIIFENTKDFCIDFKNNLMLRVEMDAGNGYDSNECHAIFYY
jgi:hypothetical protein